MNLHNLDDFTLAYLECALWSSHDFREDGSDAPLDDDYGIEDIAPECLAQAVEDCKAFYEAHHEAWQEAHLWSDEQAGHDFWLTRNGHGAGFWDRYYGGHRGAEVGRMLTAAAKVYGPVDLYVGDNGLIYC